MPGASVSVQSDAKFGGPLHVEALPDHQQVGVLSCMLYCTYSQCPLEKYHHTVLGTDSGDLTCMFTALPDACTTYDTHSAGRVACQALFTKERSRCHIHN